MRTEFRWTACVLAAFVAAGSARASTQVQQPPSGEVERYRQEADGSERPVDQYNFGTALLREGQTDLAQEPLKVATASDRELVRSSSYYNYGISTALQGQFGEEDPAARRTALLAARDAFRQVLRELPDDEDGRWNLELVERWLEEDEQEDSGGGGSSGGDAESQGGGGAGGAPAQGPGDEPLLSEEEAARLLDQAGEAEAAIRDRVLGRNRFQEPQVERNW